MVLLRASPPFWFRLSPENGEDAAPPLVEVPLPQLEPGLSRISRSEAELLGPTVTARGPAEVYSDGDIIVIPNQEFIDRMPAASRKDILRALGSSRAQEFRGRTKSTLIQELALATGVDSTDQVLRAYKNYAFYGGYSAWLLNDITQVLTRIAGDVPAKCDYLPVAKAGLLQEALKSGSVTKGPVAGGRLPDEVDGRFQWCNAIPITFAGPAEATTEFRAVVGMYTVHQDYNIRRDTQAQLAAFLRHDLAARYFDRLTRLAFFRRLPRNLDMPMEFVSAAVHAVCQQLGWESCSVFLKDPPNSKALALVASHPLQSARGAYVLTASSLTVTTFTSNTMCWSYDICHDQRNSHILDDPTETEPRNWIGVPISAHGGSPVGVLRVKNRKRRGPTDDTHFTVFDMRNLEAVASEIGSVLEQASGYAQRKATSEERAQEIRNLEDFLRTFRHEIRSPIQAVCLAPEKIGVVLREAGLLTREDIPKKLREVLVDFKATGDRLEMIAKALTLNPDEVVKAIVQCNVYKEGVAPVLAFAEPYALKRGRPIEVDKDSLLVNMHLDAIAFSMAFHALIDNAIKYADRGSTIEVFGQQVSGGHQVVVKNETRMFAIPTHEAQEIRKKYVRGSAARDQKLDGCGIGLYLADRIMALHGGELVLLRNESPVTFALRLRS